MKRISTRVTLALSAASISTFLLFLSHASGQTNSPALSASKDVVAALQVSNVLYVHAADANPKNAGREDTTVTFTVVNGSSQALAAFSVRIAATMPDGRTLLQRGCEFDLTGDIGYKGNAVLTTSVPLEPGGSRNCSSGSIAPPKLVPVSVAIVPAYAVLLDGTVLGDRAEAMASFFEPQQALAAVYSRHLTQLGSIDQSSPDAIISALSTMSTAHQAQSRVAPVPVGNSQAARSTMSAEAQIAANLANVNQISSHSSQYPPGAYAQIVSKMLSFHVAEIQRRLANATAYSNPK